MLLDVVQNWFLRVVVVVREVFLEVVVFAVVSVCDEDISEIGPGVEDAVSCIESDISVVDISDSLAGE